MNIKILHMSLKMIIAGLIALFIAYFLQIQNYTTASAIAILSIQWTRTEFIQIAIKRLISGIIGVLLVGILFLIFGIEFWVYAIFITIFIFSSWIFEIQEGIVPTVVLSTHFLFITSVTWPFVLEEIGILLIAIIIALLVNMLYPKFSLKKQINDLHNVDKIIKLELEGLVNNLKENNVSYNTMDKSFNLMLYYMEEAQMVDKDIILQNDHRYLTYLYMRKTQLDKLVIINNHISMIKGNHPYKIKIADFLNNVSNNIGFEDKATKLMDQLISLRNYFIEADLPQNRKDFETRAMLFQILNEIETFLMLKIDFHKQYPTFKLEREGT